MVSHGRGKILLIEDDDDVRASMTEALEQAGYSVLTARDGREGLDLLETAPGCRAILLDLLMPGMNGWEFRVEQWRHPAVAAVPVVLLTGTVMVGRAGELLQASAWLSKPVDLDRLFQVLDELCAGPPPL